MEWSLLPPPLLLLVVWFWVLGVWPAPLWFSLWSSSWHLKPLIQRPTPPAPLRERRWLLPPRSSCTASSTTKPGSGWSAAGPIEQCDHNFRWVSRNAQSWLLIALRRVLRRKTRWWRARIGWRCQLWLHALAFFLAGVLGPALTQPRAADRACLLHH